MGGFLSYGSAKSLAYQHDFQKDIDRLYQREAYKQQIIAQREQKSRYYAELLKEHNSVSPAVNKQLEEYYIQLNNELADFAIENPNFETDVRLLQKFHSIADKFMNNPIVLRDQQAQAEFEKLRQAASSGQISAYDYEENMKNWIQYRDKGYVEGPDGEKGSFMFQNLKPFGILEAVETAKPLIGKRNITTQDPDDPRKIIETIDYDRASIRRIAKNLMASNGDISRVMQNRWNGMNEEEKALFNSNINELYAQHIEYSLDILRNDTEYDKLFLLNQQYEMQQRAKGVTDRREVYQPNYYNQVLEPYRQNGKVDPHPANIALTEFVKPGQKIDAGPNGRDFVYRTDGDDGVQYKTINLTGRIIADKTPVPIFSVGERDAPGAESGKDYIPPEARAEVSVTYIANTDRLGWKIEGERVKDLRDGKLYRKDELPFEIKSQLGPDTEDGDLTWKEDQSMTQQLLDAGATKGKISLAGLLDLDFDGSQQVADVWYLKVLMPVKQGMANLTSYENNWTSQTQVEESKKYYPYQYPDLETARQEYFTPLEGEGPQTRPPANTQWMPNKDPNYEVAKSDDEGYSYVRDKRTGNIHIQKN